MDCDRAFMVLTRAPFPAGMPQDREVLRHLSNCPSCREIAEALRPTDQIDHESLPESQRFALPAYGAVRETVRVGSKGHRRREPSPSATAPAPRRPGGRLARYDVAAPDPQIAAFTLAPQPRRSTVWDALSLLGLLASVAAGGWGLGLLVM